MKFIYSILFLVIGTSLNSQDVCCCIEIIEKSNCPDYIAEPLTVTNETCSANGTSDGAIEWLATGGAPPYVYSPSKIQTNLIAGSYGVTITDSNGCSETTSIDVLDEGNCTNCPTINVTSVATNVTCDADGTDDGTIQWNAVGGQSPYTYSLPVVQFSLPVGSYTNVATDDNGCTGERTVNIIDENDCSVGCTVAPTITSSITDLDCTNKTATLTANPINSTGTVTYSWSTGETTQSICVEDDGFYAVSVTDDIAGPLSCQVQATTNIGDNRVTGCIEGLVLLEIANPTSIPDCDMDLYSSLCVGSAQTTPPLINGSSDVGVNGLTVQLWKKDECDGTWSMYRTLFTNSGVFPACHPFHGCTAPGIPCGSHNGAFQFCNIPCGEYFLYSPSPSALMSNGCTASSSIFDFDNDGSSNSLVSATTNGPRTTDTFLFTGGTYREKSFGYIQ